MGELVLFERLKKREYSVFLDDVPVFHKENLRDAITSFSPHSTAFCPSLSSLASSYCAAGKQYTALGWL